MDLVIVGSVALDAVRTPCGEAERVLGGSAVYAAMAGSNFCRTGIVGVVGEDFPKENIVLLQQKNICLHGLQKEKGKTFFWKGVYNDLNCAETLETQLNVFADFKPVLPIKYCNCDILFLANIDPSLQLNVLRQVKHHKLSACDTMDFWIKGKKKELLEVIARIDILFINEDELRMLTLQQNIFVAAQSALAYGPNLVVVKRGEYGAIAYGRDFLFFCPVFPVYDLVDPTGAGDSFAGGFLGYLAGSRNRDQSAFRRAMLYGTVSASFSIEDFSLYGLQKINSQQIEKRFNELSTYITFR